MEDYPDRMEKLRLQSGIEYKNIPTKEEKYNFGRVSKRRLPRPDGKIALTVGEVKEDYPDRMEK